MSMQSILSASQALMKMQTVQSSNTKTQGEISVLKAEIRKDGDHALESKKEKVEELEENVSKTNEDLMDGLNEINGELKPSEENKTDNTETVENQKEPNTDKVEISASGKEKAASGEIAAESIAVGDPVTYKPVGNKIVVTPQMSVEAPVFSS